MSLLTEVDAKQLEWWPNCATADCENKSCLSWNSVFCFPCTLHLRGITREQALAEIEAIRKGSIPSDI